MLFREEHLRKILSGEKTQTRRFSSRLYQVGKAYRIKRSWYTYTDIWIVITRRYFQRLEDISQEEIRKEGYGSLEEFRKKWEDINGKGSWKPNLEVVAYEFILLRCPACGSKYVVRHCTGTFQYDGWICIECLLIFGRTETKEPATPGRRAHPPGSGNGSAKRSTMKGDE